MITNNPNSSSSSSVFSYLLLLVLFSSLVLSHWWQLTMARLCERNRREVTDVRVHRIQMWNVVGVCWVGGKD